MAPKIYHLHPLVAGPLSQWSRHFARCQAMGFDIVCVAPPFVPGASGDIFATADHTKLHPALQWSGEAQTGIARAASEAAGHGLALWLDLVIDRVAIDAAIRQRESTGTHPVDAAPCQIRGAHRTGWTLPTPDSSELRLRTR